MSASNDKVNFVKEYKDKAQRAEENKAETAILLLLDQNSRVHVENSVKHFGDQIRRKATEQDAMYMLERALQEFKEERIAILASKLVVQELERREKESPKI